MIREIPIGPLRPKWITLIKFGEREHLEEFREQGLLYLNPLSYFRKLESDPVRRDRFEGSNHIFQPSEISKLKIKNNTDGSEIVIPGRNFVGPILMGFNAKIACNIYCMFSVTRPIESPLVDDRNLGFGDAFVIVLNTQEFINRFCVAARNEGYDHECGCVEYYDPATHSGKTGPFRKPSTFEYQREFRMILRPGRNDAIRLIVGSLRDITTPVLSLAEINQIVDFGIETPNGLA